MRIIEPRLATGVGAVPRAAKGLRENAEIRDATRFGGGAWSRSCPLPVLRSRPSIQRRSLLPWLLVLGVGCVNLRAPWEGVVQQDAGSSGAGGLGPSADLGMGGGHGQGGGTANGDGAGGAAGAGGVAFIGGSAAGGGGAGGEVIGGSAGGDGGAAGGDLAGFDTGGAESGGASAGGAGGTTVSGSGGSPSCAAEGRLDSQICWYYGASGASCAATCTAHGGISAFAPNHVGSLAQGGTLAECTRLMKLLGLDGSVTSATRSPSRTPSATADSSNAFLENGKTTEPFFAHPVTGVNYMTASTSAPDAFAKRDQPPLSYFLHGGAL